MGQSSSSKILPISGNNLPDYKQNTEKYPNHIITVLPVSLPKNNKKKINTQLTFSKQLDFFLGFFL